jgi:hypothetical protein
LRAKHSTRVQCCLTPGRCPTLPYCSRKKVPEKVSRHNFNRLFTFNFPYSHSIYFPYSHSIYFPYSHSIYFPYSRSIYFPYSRSVSFSPPLLISRSPLLLLPFFSLTILRKRRTNENENELMTYIHKVHESHEFSSHILVYMYTSL